MGTVTPKDGQYGNESPADKFLRQRVVPSNAIAPGGVGRDSNGQICFHRDAQGLHMIYGEDTNQGDSHLTAGWGYFLLTGTAVGSFGYQEVGKMIPTYQPTPDGAENYGCGFLSDGRLLTTDVGNQASGVGNGQLIIWFPPFDNGAVYSDTGVRPTTPAHYCKLDIAVGTAGGIYVDQQDHIYVASARIAPGFGPGVYRYTGPFPTSDTAAGGCGQQDNTGAPLVNANTLTKEKFITPDLVNIVTPNAIVASPKGTLYVSSVYNGVIAEFDTNGVFIRRILSPVAGESLPFPSTGTPGHRRRFKRHGLLCGHRGRRHERARRLQRLRAPHSVRQRPAAVTGNHGQRTQFPRRHRDPGRVIRRLRAARDYAHRGTASPKQ